jgi:nucleoside-diphosphate kinase
MIYKKEGLKITEAKFIRPRRSKMEELYREHKSKPFFGELISFMSSGLILILFLEGENAVVKARQINDRIRDEYASAQLKMANVVHGSDSRKSARRELKIFRSLFNAR